MKWMFSLKVLDLFCGGGGASMGMHQALEEANIKHTIVGIDIREMPDYPFEFVQADIFKIGYINYNYFDFIWASPPCQAFTISNKSLRNKGFKYPNLIPITRELLLKTGKPFIIENVSAAPIRKNLLLCGEMFGLKVFRHRIFEIEGFKCYQPKHPKHRDIVGKGKYTVITGGAFRMPEKKRRKEKLNLNYGTYDDWCKAMGIHWISLEYTDKKSRKSYNTENSGPTLCSNHPLAEAIPPAYSKFIMEEYLRNHPTIMDFIQEEKIMKC
ncbi:hypothetical protein LCGC14_1909710 [marine sediment metagenome]|uniref:DNA (cytosine-5-)-methyltransferase n=1 Tax=marine sediment metagenome TaxID=412755 RepID=A0A0F9FUJ5_9ZZZZ